MLGWAQAYLLVAVGVSMRAFPELLRTAVAEGRVRERPAAEWVTWCFAAALSMCVTGLLWPLVLFIRIRSVMGEPEDDAE